MDGKGGRGPDLTSGVFRWGQSDTKLFKNIKDGIPGTDMPGLPIEDEVIWEVISYIRAYENRNETPAAIGNAESGRKLFEQHNCASCHWIGNEGGGRGPDLTRSFASVTYIRQALLDPEKNVYPEKDEPRYAHHNYQLISIVTVRGRVFAGRWVNEDTNHVVFMDEQENYHSIARTEIDQITKPKQSQMVSYRDELTARDVDDLITYVVSLRTPVTEDD